MKTKNAALEILKKQYEPLKKKYKLPEFSELNKEFEIEKIQEKETDFLLREIRRAISEKMAAFLKLFELFLNPQAAPLFILTSLKNLTLKEKEMIENIYKELVKLEIISINLDIEYNEKEEVKFIIEAMKKWKEIKLFAKEIVDFLIKFQNKNTEKKEKSYFG